MLLPTAGARQAWGRLCVLLPTAGAGRVRGQLSGWEGGPAWPGAEVMPPPPTAHRYVQSLLDIMEFLDKDPEDHRNLSQ